MNRSILIYTSLLAGLFATLSVFAETTPANSSQQLTLDQYLEQVKKSSPGMNASSLQIQGTIEASKEGELVYSPHFTFNGNYTNDKRQVTNFLLTGTVTSGDNMVFGVDEQFNFGLKANLSYNLTNTLTTGISPLLYPPGKFQFSMGQIELDLTQSLWKNGFGVETRATATLAEASSLASHYSERYKLKQLLSQAETAYYKLGIAREAYRLQEEILDHAKKILEWSDRRARNQLADKSDMLQAKASYQQRQLDLEAMKNDQRSAQLTFNTLRDSTVEEVNESVAPINTQSILDIQAPKRAEVTDDVKAAEQNERVVVANNELSRQKAQPDLSLFGTIAYNGVDTYLSSALADSFSTKHPEYVIGVKFSYPLFFLDTSAVRSGRIKQQLAAESQTVQTRLDNAQNWVDLQKKFSETKGRLKMAEDLVVAQKEKLDHEKYRFNLGRTTTFQVLTYEQDYSQALITRLHIEQEILALHSQMKAYSEE